MLCEICALESDGTWGVRCSVVMPDHVHSLVVLGHRMSLGKSIARLKAKTAASIRTIHPEFAWERSFFDHRVRADEDHISLFLYLYLNPYRAHVCGRFERWPYYYCCDQDWAWFSRYLDSDRPQPEWLERQVR